MLFNLVLLLQYIQYSVFPDPGIFWKDSLSLLGRGLRSLSVFLFLLLLNLCFWLSQDLINLKADNFCFSGNADKQLMSI